MVVLVRILFTLFALILFQNQTVKAQEAEASVRSPFWGINGAGLELPDSTDPTAFRTHATMFGIGYRNMLDTYLSPQTYTGVETRMLREHSRLTRLLDGRVRVQNILQGHMAYCKSPTEDGKDLAGQADWSVSWQYGWRILPSLTIWAGPGAAVHGGFVYNTRNGNNPAQARLSADIGCVGTALWNFRIGRKPVSLRYRAELPLLGLMFSPNYGQSYYEIFSLGHYDHNVCLTNPFEAFDLDQMISMDIPLGSHTLRAGYLCSIRQSHVNHLKAHDWSHLLMVGYVKHFYLIKNAHRKMGQQK